MELPYDLLGGDLGDSLYQNAMKAIAPPPSLWAGDSIDQYLSGMKQWSWDSLKAFEIPSIPPFDSVWIEWREGKYGYACWITGSGLERLFHVYTMEHGYSKGPLMLPVAAFGNYGDDGILTSSKVGAYFDRTPPGMEDRYQEYLSIFEYAVTIAQLSVMFSHCKNVDLVDRLPKRHEQREAMRKGEPILKYHEIVIDPNRSYGDSESVKASENKPTRALHIARGHFAHYSEEKPLFGKYAGTFWIPAHVRGNKDFGVVKSTYKVKALNQ
jgi:hypothetical protein